MFQHRLGYEVHCKYMATSSRAWTWAKLPLSKMSMFMRLFIRSENINEVVRFSWGGMLENSQAMASIALRAQ
jgi:hypothetical protein